MPLRCSFNNIALKKGHFSFRYLGDFSFDSKTEKIPIIGETGSGKSSLMKALFGLEKLDSGSVTWEFPDGKKIKLEGDSLHALDRERKHYFGFAFQNSTLTNYLNIQENLLYPLLLKGEKYSDAVHTIEEKIKLYLTDEEKTDINRILHQYPHELSGGQKQRISLLQSIIHDPYVLLADEPTGSLDTKTRKQIMDTLYRWVENKEYERMLLWVTHHEDDLITSGAKHKIHVFIDKDHSSCQWQSVGEADDK